MIQVSKLGSVVPKSLEKQTGNDEVNAALSELDPKVGDFLLLPYGQTDFVVQVLDAGLLVGQMCQINDTVNENK